MTTQTIKIDGRLYRVTDSTIPAGEKFDSIRKAYASRGIKDRVNVLPPRAKKSHVQAYIWLDGSATLASSGMDCIIAREARELATRAKAAALLAA
jgi:hypothetical protein